MTNVEYFHPTNFKWVSVDRCSGCVHIYDDPPKIKEGTAVPEAVMTSWR